MRISLYKDRILPNGPGRLPDELASYKRSFPVCGDIVRRLKAVNPDMEISPLLRERLSQISTKQKDLLEIKAKEDTDGDSRLYPYQRVGVEWLLRIKRGILADEQGLGKTVIAASACQHIKPDKRIGIICNDTNITNWVKHMREYCPANNSVKVKNYEGAFAKESVDILIIDEAHKIRNRKTGWFKIIRETARYAEYVFILTATPTINADYDLWTLLSMCDPIRFSSYWSYIFRFFVVSDNGFGMKIESVKEFEKENLLRMISTYILHRDESEIQLPKMTRREVIHELEEDHRELYKPMEEAWVVSLGDKTFSADVKVAQITRLRQMSITPRILFPDYKGSSKIDTIIDLVKASDQNIVIFTFFAEAAQLVKDTLLSQEIPCETMTGSVSRKKRDILVEDFGDKFRVLVLTHGTGGEGLNLVQATQAIFLDLTWHPAGNQHAQKRIHRIGQDKDVEIIVVRSKDTIEDYISEVISKKGKMTTHDLIAKYKEKHESRDI